jgi:hypothetical protein
MSMIDALFARLTNGDAVDKTITNTLRDTGALVSQITEKTEQFFDTDLGRDVRDASVVTTVAGVAYVAGRVLYRKFNQRHTGE